MNSAELHMLGVGGDAAVFRELTRYAESSNVVLQCVPESSAGMHALSSQRWDLVLVAVDQDPAEKLGWWLDMLGRLSPQPRLVALVPSSSIAFALEARHVEVFDVLPLPIGRERFERLVRRIRAARAEQTIPLVNVEPVTIGSIPLVSASPSMLPVFRTIAQVAPTTATVLILGESGTGKELIARAIHQHGPSSGNRFVPVNCAAIPENLLESELFGHEKGAFTGAVARRTGRFERANGGTLFLDEIGDMSLPLQSKILRAVQEREIERVGGTDSIAVNVRLIAATNQDLQELIKQQRFREDLYYRLAVITIKLPRLAERENDIMALTSAFLREFGKRYGRSFDGITDTAFDLLCQHEWLGNVRELRNVIERAVLVADGDVLRAEHLPDEWLTNCQPKPRSASPLSTLQEVEAMHIARVLEHTGRQMGEAARILGVHRNTLARKTREYGL